MIQFFICFFWAKESHGMAIFVIGGLLCPLRSLKDHLEFIVFLGLLLDIGC